MKPKYTALQIEKLEKERTSVFAKLRHLRQAVKSEIDGDMGEGDPELAKRETLTSLIQIEECKLQALDQALAEARQGTYCYFT